MVEMQNIQMPLMIVILYAGMTTSYFLPFPESLIVFFASFGISLAYMIVLMAITPLLARRFNWIWATPTSDQIANGGWTWPARFQIPTRGNPGENSQWNPNLMWLDGTLGCFVTPIVPAFKKNRHPRYNQKKKIGRYWVIHRLPWGVLMPYSEGPVVYWGNTCKGVQSTWAVFDEIMPSVSPEGRSLNHVPFTNSKGQQEPVFVIETARGTRNSDEKRRKMARFSAVQEIEVPAR